MSLINDALKRAKQAQQAAPPAAAAGPQFRPVEAAPATGRRPNLMLIAILSALVVMIALLVWQTVHNRGNSGSESAKSTSVQQSVASVVPAPPAPVAIVPTPTNSPGVAVAPAKPAEMAASGVSQSITNAAPRTNPAPTAAVSSIAAPDSINPVPVTVSLPEKPAPPKLQAIVFNPTRPSAMISGKTLFIGDKFGNWRLTAIDQESATLVGGGKTNVLSLPQ